MGPGSAPRKQTTVGLSKSLDLRQARRSPTAAAGGLEISTITPVSGSSCSAASPASIVAPPTASLRSRPPVPMACDTPAPARASPHVTPCRPVPAALTRPTLPRGTALAKPSATPLMIAVPASGPMHSSPRSAASFLSAISSSSGTLSEKSRTCRPCSSAVRASAAA